MARKPYVVKSIEGFKRSLKRAGKDRIYHAYKYSNESGRSPNFPFIEPILICEEGAKLVVRNASRNKNDTCAPGVNVATRKWCIRGRACAFRLRDENNPYGGTRRLWLVEFRRRDIACVPNRSDGKFRLFRCKVVKQLKVR